MHRYCLCLFIGLLVVAFLQSPVMGHMGTNLPDECCFKFYGRIIPINKIDYYTETRVDCTKPGAIFTTVKGSRICVDSRLKWVKNAMKKIDERNL